MKVYILFRDLYDGREVEGVYMSLEAAKARFPEFSWRQEEGLQEEQLWWRAMDDRRAFGVRDVHIEEQELTD